MSEMREAMAWLAKCGVGALIFVLVCRVATAYFGGGLEQPAITTRDGNLITLNRFAKEPIPDVVLVGSSLTFRLKEEYFVTPRVRNLALAGGSPVTGLTIVANRRTLPRVVLIETNVLSRTIDTALVARYSEEAVAEPRFLRPVRTAVAAYENWVHAPPRDAQALAARNVLLGRPPSDFDNHVAADRALREMNDEDPSEATRTNVEALKQLIADIEQRGTRAFLIDVPVSAHIEGSRFVRVTKEIVEAAFPDPERWLRIDPPRAELRWADGVHLDERSALIVVKSLERGLAGRPGSVSAPQTN
jgi:hypothetical protein